MRLTLFAVTLFACRTESEPPPFEPAKLDVAAVNALVPEKLRGTLVFEQRDLEGYRVAVPKRWVPSPLSKGGTATFMIVVEPTVPDRNTFGYRSRVQLYSNCDGPCGEVRARDMAAFADRSFRWARDRIVLDKKEANRLTRVAGPTADDDFTGVSVAWWETNGPRLETCEAVLADELKDATAAFIHACQHAVWLAR